MIANDKTPYPNLPNAGGCPVLVLRQGAWAKNHSVQQDHGPRRGEQRQREAGTSFIFFPVSLHTLKLCCVLRRPSFVLVARKRSDGKQRCFSRLSVFCSHNLSVELWWRGEDSRLVVDLRCGAFLGLRCVAAKDSLENSKYKCSAN